MKCNNCNKEISNASKFCEFCGKQMTKGKGYSEIVDQLFQNRHSEIKATPKKRIKWESALVIISTISLVIIAYCAVYCTFILLPKLEQQLQITLEGESFLIRSAIDDASSNIVFSLEDIFEK
jgi:hypothetical protein